MPFQRKCKHSREDLEGHVHFDEDETHNHHPKELLALNQKVKPFREAPPKRCCALLPPASPTSRKETSLPQASADRLRRLRSCDFEGLRFRIESGMCALIEGS